MPKRNNDPLFEQEFGYKRQRNDDSDPIDPVPSMVLHVRKLHPKATEADLIEAFNHFGTVAYVVVFPMKRQGLVEYLSIDSAIKTMEYLNNGGQIAVLNSSVLVNYSTSRSIERIGFESAVPSRVLVFNVKNLQDNHIDAEIMAQITRAHGYVQKIAIVRRPFGIVALVQFATVEEATKAKYALNGADIYAGSCTLKIEYSKEENVKIRFNDADHRDYVNTGSTRERMPLLQSWDHFNNAGFYRSDLKGDMGDYPYNTQFGYDMRYNNAIPHAFDDPHLQNENGHQTPDSLITYTKGYQRSAGPGYFQFNEGVNLFQPNDLTASDLMEKGSVVLVYGVDHTNFTCQILFNVFCIYGNVNKIRFMRRKTHMAMVQLGDPLQAKTLKQNLDGIELFGKKLLIRMSKQVEVLSDPDPFPMEKDSSPSFLDLTGSRLQRYSTPEFASRNHPVKPTDTLHFFNAPPGISENRLYEIWETSNAPTPSKFFINAGRHNKKSNSGFIKFETINEAADSLALVNHTSIDVLEYRLPWILKIGYYDGDFSKLRSSKDPEV